MSPEEKKILLDSYLAKVSPIPTLPDTVSRILQMTNNPDIEVEDIADVILKDKVLTARMIRLVNSAFWGIRRQIASVREAIVYLGLHQIRSIALTTSLFNAFQSNNNTFKISSIWEHGLGCAMISRIIAEKIEYPDCEKAYLAGLMHDIGEVILSQFSLKEFDDVVALVQKERISFFEAEEKILGITHADFGDWFQLHWGFDNELSEVISTHHTPDKGTINPLLVSIVVIANLFCKVRGLDYGFQESIQIAMRDEFAWQIISKSHASLSNMDLERFTLDLDNMVSEVKRVVKETYSGYKE